MLCAVRPPSLYVLLVPPVVYSFEFVYSFDPAVVPRVFVYAGVCESPHFVQQEADMVLSEQICGTEAVGWNARFRSTQGLQYRGAPGPWAASCLA